MLRHRCLRAMGAACLAGLWVAAGGPAGAQNVAPEEEDRLRRSGRTIDVGT